MGRINYLFKKFHEKGKYHNATRNIDIWVFGEWFGNRACDNSLYLANYIADFHPEISIFWVAKKEIDSSLLSSKIKVLPMDDTKTKDVLNNAGVAIMNQGLGDFSSDAVNYFSGAVTVNLWHGLMWKRINFDATGHSGVLADLHHKILAKLEEAEWHLTSSTEISKIIKTAFCTKERKMIRAGYPRNSIFYDKNKIRLCRKKVFLNLNLTESAKIITYMPTFRDKTNDVFSFEKLIDNQELNTILEKSNAYIVEKSHFISAERSDKGNVKENQNRIKFLNHIGATELLAASDMLITDYSSCFFDYLILNRPIIHFIYDYDYYVNNDRGVYYTKEEVACGKTPETVEELMLAIEEYLNDPMLDVELRDKQKNRFWEYDSEDTCEQIYREIRRIQGIKGDSK